MLWEKKKKKKTEYHVINDNEIHSDKTGQDFKDFIYGTKFKKYKKIYFPITAILTLTINANRENCFLNNGMLKENGKQTYKRIEFRRDDEK